MVSVVKGKAWKDEEFQSLDDRDVVCGFGPFRGRWLQSLANPKMFLAVYCALGILQGAYFTYTVGIVSTIEKRFAFDSKASGLILIADNLSPIFTSVLIGYYGGQAHRPRIIGAGMMVVVISCFLSASPYFIFGPGLHLLTKEMGKQNSTLCHAADSMDESSCETDRSSHFATLTAVALFFAGSFLSGFGGSAYYTAGIAYLDDNVKKENSPQYFSLTMAIRLVGPALGFGLSSFCLRKFEEPSLAPDIATTDPRWVGAWWLGFVILGLCTLVFSIPMFFFPRRLRSAPIKENENGDANKMPKLKDMPQSLKRLMKNAIYVCHTLSLVFHLNGILGYFILMPRFMEAHFHKSASDASILSGSTSIISMLVGLFCGGMIIRRFKPKPRFLTGYMVFVHVVTIATFLIVMFFACPPMKMAHPPSPTGSLSLVNQCNENCGCQTNIFQPVCGSDSVTNYFSPCHAGCTKAVTYPNLTHQVFEGCGCSQGESDEGRLIEGLCPFDCDMFTSYILVLAVAKLISATGRVGNMLITLRCVDRKDKTLALGGIGCVISAFAFIPHPLIFGAMADSACIVWEESCGSTGNCWLYDVDKLRYIMHGGCVAFMAVGTLFDFAVFLLSDRLKDFYDDLPQEPDPGAVNYSKVANEDDEVELFSKPPPALGNSYNKLNSGI